MSRPVVALGMDAGLDTSLLTPADWARLEAVADVPDPKPIEFLDGDARRRLRGAEVLLASWGCPTIDAAFLEAAPSLRLVAYAAGSVKHIVTAEMWDRGVVITSAAEAMAVPVAEFTLAAIVLGRRQTFAGRDALRDRLSFDAARESAQGMLGTRIGVVGASRVGRHLIELLAHHDVEVGVYDPFLTAIDANQLAAVPMELDDLLRWSDVVTLHAPSTPATASMIGAEQLALIRDGGWLVNTARGALVDHDALARECAGGRLSAWLDTTAPEPLPPDSPLLDLPNVVVTPHIAGGMGNDLRLGTASALTEIERHAAGLSPLHPVTPAELATLA